MQITAENIDLTPLGFAEGVLGLPLYDWQAKAINPLLGTTGANAELRNIAVAAPNGSGKDDRIIPAAAFWWLNLHNRGKVVITSSSDQQLTNQTIAALDKHWPKFGWKEPIRSPRYTLRTPKGGVLIAFVSNTPGRVEGFHKEDNVDGPLLQIVNEAKTVPDEIFTGLDRWTVNARLWVSSPGSKTGRFWKCFTEHRKQWNCIQAGLADCPHITKAQVQFWFDTYGPEHPMTRSALYGEFMNQEDGEFFCVTVEEVEACLNYPARHMPGFRYGFFDFADGRAENVFVVRDGNKYTIEDAWREPNEDAVVGRCINLMRKANLKPEQVGGDAAAKSTLDKLAANGWSINRQSFGAPDGSGIYQSWSALAWQEGGKKIRDREVIIPRDDILISQLTTRKKVWLPSGKLGVEDKIQMAKSPRNLTSPDRADALFGAMAALDLNLMNPKPFDISGWREEMDYREDRELVSQFGAGGCI